MPGRPRLAEAFDSSGSAYDKEIYQSVRKELTGNVHAELYGLYANQLHNLDSIARKSFVPRLDVRCFAGARRRVRGWGDAYSRTPLCAACAGTASWRCAATSTSLTRSSLT